MKKEIGRPIVEKGGCAIYEMGNEIILVNRRTSGMFTLNFVLLLIGIILIVNGILLMTSHMMLGSSFILVSVVCFFLVYRIFKKLQMAKTLPPNENTTVAVIEVEKKRFLNAKRALIAPLHEVKFSKGFQITSSAPSIIAKWGRGQSKVLFKFNGLMGGADAFIAYFKQKGYWE